MSEHVPFADFESLNYPDCKI